MQTIFSTRTKKMLHNTTRCIRHSIAYGLALFVLSGCFSPILHPIEGSDIISISRGDILIHENEKPIFILKDGFYFSEEYVEEIMKAKVKK